jgi:hypothetical protein
MSPERMGVAAVCAVTVMVSTLAWAGQQATSGGTPAAVVQCGRAQAMAEQTIGMMEQRLEAARRENSPSAMRAAIDDLQAALRRLRTDLAPCRELQPPGGTTPHPGHGMPGMTPQ